MSAVSSRAKASPRNRPAAVARAVSAVIGPIAAALSPRAMAAPTISQKFVTVLELVKATRSMMPAAAISRTRSIGACWGFAVL